MDWLEEELKRALAPGEPPPGFAARVLAAARPKRLVEMRRWLAAAAALVLISGSGLAWRHHRGMVAKERVMLAMRITAGTLNRIQAHMHEVRQ